MVTEQAGTEALNPRPERAYYLDWLRVAVVFLLVPYHAAWVFMPGNWWINNIPDNLATQALVQVLDQFQMPLLFVVAGAATWFSLGVRTGKQYFVERLGRLLVPIIFGMLVLNPPSYFASLLHYGQGATYDSSYFAWFPTYLKDMLFPWQPGWGPGTLWFVWYLFIYSMTLVPLFLYFRGRGGQRLISWLAAFFEKRGALLLLVIPIALLRIYPPPNVYSWAQILYFVIFFVYGFLLYSEPRFQRGIEKSGPIALAGGAVSMILVMLLIFPAWDKAPLGAIFWPALHGEPGTPGQALYLILHSTSCWCWIIGLIYLAKRYLNFSNRFLRYANDAVLPYYLVHCTFIVVVAYYVVPLPMDVLPKFIIIFLSTLAGTMAFYEIARRLNVTRFFLGMRLNRTVDTDRFRREVARRTAGLPELQLDPQVPSRSPSGRTTIQLMEALQEGRRISLVVRLGQESLSVEGVTHDRARILLNQRLDRAIRDYRRNVSRRARRDGSYEVDLVLEDMPATPQGINDCRQIITRAVDAIESA